MDSGGSMQGSEERGVEKTMDDYLKSLGYQRKKIAKDGSCLFRAVAEQVLHCQSLHTQVRAQCVEFLRQNRDGYEAFIEGDFEDYLFKLRDPQQWVGEVEINALAVMYKRDFSIFQEPGKKAVDITDNGFKDKVLLCFLNGNHYDSVYPIGRIRNAALCQSILYELLYEGVFKVDRGALSRTGRPSHNLIDDNMAACASSDESDVDTGEAAWAANGPSSTSARSNGQSYRGRGRGRQLPERVKRSLNPTLLRNVEYDVWIKTKKAQQKMDYCIAAGMQFTVGDLCQVQLDSSGRSYNATIKEVPPNNGPVTVYIEDLGRKQVPLWNIRPPGGEGNWSTVVNRDKRLSNGHGEWEERGKGRGRGKSAQAASSSVTQAMAAGSGGRVQKQNSWPPQAAAATAEETGGASKPSRKSAGLLEFGLTEKQRKAKEEEERNVALVEIQLRDELSFPALGTEGGKKKGGEKRRSQRSKASPEEDVRAPSPSAGDKPSSSSSPPLTVATAPSAPTTSKPPAAASSDSIKEPVAANMAANMNANMAANANANVNANMAASVAVAAPSSNSSSYTTAAAPPASPSPPPLPPPHPIPPSSAPFTYVSAVLPAAAPPSSSSSSSSSKLPAASSSPPPPTFIAPIAPSPTAAQGFTRFSPPITHSPSPPPSSSFSSLVRPTVQESLPAPAPNSLPNAGVSLSASQTFQTSLSQNQNQDQISASQSEKQAPPTLPPIQTQSQAPLPPVQIPQIPSDVDSSSAPQSHLQPPQPQGPSHPHTSQASHSHPSMLPPHPSQLPYPASLSLSAPLTHPSPQSDTTQTPNEAAPPHPEHPPHPAQLQPLPPHPQSIPGAVPVQQLSQLYQDPVYPGFPQGAKGEIVPTPPFSSSTSGDDLPQDVNVLRFFFNLGVKAYLMPMFAPYMYLLPLQQAHTVHPRPSSRSPSPHYPPPSFPSKLHEPYLPPQCPPASATPQYEAQLAEAPRPGEACLNQAGHRGVNPHPPPHRMPGPSLSMQQIPAPRNPGYSVGYPAPAPQPYAVPPPSSQGYHPSQSPGHPLYPPFPPTSMGYHSSPTPEEVSQGTMERIHPNDSDPVLGHGHIRVPGRVESPNNNRMMMFPHSYGLKKDSGESLPRTVLLVDPPLNNTPILTIVSDPDVKDVPGSMAMTMKPSNNNSIISNSSSPGSPYRGHRKPFKPNNKPYAPPGYAAEPLSVACSTEDDWAEEGEGFKPATLHHGGGQRRSYRGGGVRGRGGHDARRGAYRRRQGGDMGAGHSYVQFTPSYLGRGRGF